MSIKDNKVRFVWMLFAFARAASQHLLKQNARFDRAQKHDEFQVRNVYAGREHVYGNDDAGFRTIAKFADALERTIYATCNFLDERIAAPKHIAGNVDKVVGVRRVRQIVHGEDQRFREATKLLFMFVAIVSELFEDWLLSGNRAACGDRLQAVRVVVLLGRNLVSIIHAAHPVYEIA